MCPCITISIRDMIWGKLERPEMRHRLEIPNFASALFSPLFISWKNGNFHHNYNHCQPESTKQIKTIPKISLNIRQFDVKKGKPNFFGSVVIKNVHTKSWERSWRFYPPFPGMFWLPQDTMTPWWSFQSQKRPYTPGTWSCCKTFVWTSFARP